MSDGAPPGTPHDETPRRLELGASMAAVWPAARDYVQALADPEHAFATDELRAGRTRPGLFGLPASAAGQNAIAFPIAVGGREQAVRCFTHPPGEVTRRRYLLLEQHLRLHPRPAFASAVWQDRGVRIGGTWWPIVRMPWVPGDTLGVAVAARLGEPGRLRAMAAHVRHLSAELTAARMAHGDLQHGNVLVDEADVLRLVDYDAVFVPGAETLVPDERGHRSYQHPERIATGAWGPTVDTFSALVLHVSLLALAADPTLWADLHTGENLVLGPEDLADPEGSTTIARLRASPDPEVGALADLLARCARAPLHRLTSLEALLTARVALPPRTDVADGAPGARPDWLADPAADDDHTWADVPPGWEAGATEAPEYVWDATAEPPGASPWRWPVVVALVVALALLVTLGAVALWG